MNDIIASRFLKDREAEIRYCGLMKIWHDETAVQSFGIADHPAYSAILAMKDDFPLVKFLLQDIGRFPHQVFPILWTIVPNPPIVPEEIRGKIKKLFSR